MATSDRLEVPRCDFLVDDVNALKLRCITALGLVAQAVAHINVLTSQKSSGVGLRELSLVNKSLRANGLRPGDCVYVEFRGAPKNRMEKEGKCGPTEQSRKGSGKDMGGVSGVRGTASGNNKKAVLETKKRGRICKEVGKEVLMNDGRCEDESEDTVGKDYEKCVQGILKLSQSPGKRRRKKKRRCLQGERKDVLSVEDRPQRLAVRSSCSGVVSSVREEFPADKEGSISNKNGLPSPKELPLFSNACVHEANKTGELASLPPQKDRKIRPSGTFFSRLRGLTWIF